MDPEDDDPETIAAFTKLLKKVGGSWLDEIRPLTSSPDHKTKGADPIAEFFREQLGETKTALQKAQEQVERARDLMTPEQLTLWRSPPAGGKSGDGNPDTSGPQNKGKQPDSGNTPALAGDPPPPKRRKWL